MDLNKMVMASLEKMEKEGKVQEIVDKKIASTIEDIVGDLFGWGGGFKKDLKAQVESQLDLNLSELNLASYNALIMSAVKEKLDDQIASEGVARINESIEELLTNNKKEYKLSELVKELAGEIDDIDDLGYEDYHEMTMLIDDSFSLSKIISLDSESDKSKHDCKYQFWVDKKDGKISNISIKEDRYRSRDVNQFDARAIMRGFRGLEETLFKMYASGAKLVVDENDVELEVRNPEYD